MLLAGTLVLQRAGYFELQKIVNEPPCMTQIRNSSICRELSGTQITQPKYAHVGSNSLAICLVLTALEAITDDKYQWTYQACIHTQYTCIGFLTQFLICWIAMEILTVVSPVLL